MSFEQSPAETPIRPQPERNRERRGQAVAITALTATTLLSFMRVAPCTSEKATTHDQTHSGGSRSAKRIRVDLKTQRLTCWEGNKLVYSFPCSSGRDGRLTPTGTYQVEEKMANWGWKDTLDFCDCGPTMPFKADHRKGELFPRGNWAIHGWPKDETTNKWLDSPDLVGKQRFSDGCVELLRSDDKKVYDWASIGTPVIIR